MTGFAWGTVGLWTAARGWRAGLGILIASPVLVLMMAFLNHATFNSEGTGNAIFRVGYVGINYLVTLAVVLL